MYESARPLLMSWSEIAAPLLPFGIQVRYDSSAGSLATYIAMANDPYFNP
jgi:hypothetical protein